MHAFLLAADFFLQNQLFEKSFQEYIFTIRVPNSLEQYQARHFVGPDLVINCLPKLSAEGTIRQRTHS